MGVARRGPGELERAVLAVLWEADGTLSPGEVATGSTPTAGCRTARVATILSRLLEKGALERRRDGRSFRYVPVADPAGLAARGLSALLDGRAGSEAVLTRFIADLSGRDEQVLRLLLERSSRASSQRAEAIVRLVVYLPLLVPALAAAFARPLSARLDPRYGAWLLTAAALVLAAASTRRWGCSRPTRLVRVPLVAHLGHWSPAVVRRNDSASVAVACAAGVLLTVLCVAAGRFAVRRVRALRAAYAEAACLPGTGPIVTARRRPDAYALPGWPGGPGGSWCPPGCSSRSTSRGGGAARPRAAHLTQHHYLYVSVAQLAAAANPLLRPLAAAVEYASNGGPTSRPPGSWATAAR